MTHILLIDDQPYVGKFLSEELDHEGCRVTSVGDAESAKRYLKDSRPDLVLLDLYLDGFEGWEVLRNIKTIDQSLPVFIWSAYDSFREDPRLSQADGYVIKSFGCLDELKERIADILD